MYSVIIILAVVVALLIMLVVLAQNPKGGGLSSQFGGAGGGNQLMGVQRTGNLLEKITWGLGVVLVVLSISANIMLSNRPTQEEGTVSPNVEKAQESGGALPGMQQQDRIQSQGEESGQGTPQQQQQGAGEAVPEESSEDDSEDLDNLLQ